MEASFKGFSPKALEFFKTLKHHNTKPWFEAHKHIYEQEILARNRAFVEEMGAHLLCLVPTIHAIPKINHSLFRIYRDTRFSKDKTPIKTHTAVLFWQGRGSRMQSSSFYLHYNASEVFVATGIRNFKEELLKRYRNYILDESKRLELFDILKTLENRGFKINTPHYKRLPQGFNKGDKAVELALYNAIYAYTTFKPDAIFFSEAIIDRLFGIYEAMLPLQQWLYRMTIS